MTTKPYKTIFKNINSNTVISFDIPTKCPHCNAYVQPNIIDNKLLNYTPQKLLIITYNGDCCSKSFYATYEYKTKEKCQIFDIFPHLRPNKLPNKIQELSPRFVNLYNQSYTAEQNGHFELAGSGYRNSIEILIKDFAINKLDANKKTVCKMSLYDSIGEYLKEVDISTSADVVRVLGNDYSHYQKNYESTDFIVIKKYLEIFIQQIETKLLLLDPIVPTRRNQP